MGDRWGAAFVRIGWQASFGLGGSFAPDWVAGITGIRRLADNQLWLFLLAPLLGAALAAVVYTLMSPAEALISAQQAEQALESQQAERERRGQRPSPARTPARVVCATVTRGHVRRKPCRTTDGKCVCCSSPVS